MLPIILQQNFSTVTASSTPDNDRHDPGKYFQIQEILHLQTISLQVPDILAELEKQHTDPPLSL